MTEVAVSEELQKFEKQREFESLKSKAILEAERAIMQTNMNMIMLCIALDPEDSIPLVNRFDKMVEQWREVIEKTASSDEG